MSDTQKFILDGHIVLDRAIALPPEARGVAIVLENGEGKRIGEVARKGARP